MAEGNAEFPTTIGADASFKGQLHFEKGVRLLGTFEGEINSKGNLVIANGATFSGEAHSGDIRVEGEVAGNLHAQGKIQLAATGRLEGDIHAAKLEVAEGAILVGRCAVGARSDGKPGATTPVTKAVETMPEARPELKGVPKEAPAGVKK